LRFRKHSDGSSYPIAEGESGLDEAIDNVVNEPEPQPVNPNICSVCGSQFDLLQEEGMPTVCKKCAFEFLESMGMAVGLAPPETSGLEDNGSLPFEAPSSGRGSPQCSKCGHVYAKGESHEIHWRQHPD